MAPFIYLDLYVKALAPGAALTPARPIGYTYGQKGTTHSWF